jgi:phosphoribosylamine--glycine ligase
MNILLIGSGGREHAIATKLAASPNVRLYAAPSNPGITRVAETAPINVSERNEMVAFCHQAEIDLVVIGPEAPLAAGLADDLRAASIAVFGPSRVAAQLESSKGFAKEFMRRHGVPTASFRRFTAAQLDEAVNYLASQSLPIVIKADGLAAGKGVVVAETHQQALDALVSMLGGKFGEASASVVIEECMQGEEASIFAITDGERFLTLAAAQDHKRIGEGDTGENTGGMGAYAPAPIVTDEVLRKTNERIIAPVLRGMSAEGMPFVGCLYVGLMIDKSEPKVVEFNARFGDPETQAVLSILKGDFAALLQSAARGALRSESIQSVSNGAACCVVLASQGYPNQYETGKEIHGTEAAESAGVQVFHAGTAMRNGRLVTSGGRVLGVTGRGATLAEAIKTSYEAVAQIEFDGKTYRRDIGAKGLR